MAPKTATRIFLVLLLVAAAVRLNNVLTFPALRAFDGFGHFVYIWFMADQWRVPLATTGWSFFHPPLYYAFMASVWTTLSSTDPVWRLTIGTGIIALLGLVHGVAAFAIARRHLPHRPLVWVISAGLPLFVPVLLYSSGFLGNENLNGILCTISIFTLLWVLRGPGWARGAVLGACLGLAMLSKFTSIAIVAGALGSIGVQTAVRRNWKAGTATLMAATSMMLIVCGWFYARNVSVYGTPFKLSRDEFMVRHVENYQSQGKRDFWEYVLFDPVILRRPQWPRGLQLTGDFSPDRPRSALRESVPTGVYANAWFDGGTGIIVPPVTVNDESRRAGQILLTLAVVPSLLILVGIGTAVIRLWRHGWDDTRAPMLLTFGFMTALFVQATSAVPMHAAVKATYLTPISVIWAFWLALGADRLGAASPRWLRRAALVCAALVLACVGVFTNNLVVARNWLVSASTNSAPWQNLYGIVYYAGGDRARALELFRQGAEGQWYLAEENLGYLLLHDGKPLEALYHVRSAAHLQPRQSFGTRDDRAYFNRITRADYENQLAIIYYELGWLDQALAAAEKAYALDPTVPEIEYDLAVTKLASALARSDATRAHHLARATTQSRQLLMSASAKDPLFFEIMALVGVLDGLDDQCGRAVAMIEAALAPHADQPRDYPVATGPGNVHAASLGRRRYITKLPEALRPEHQLARCNQLLVSGTADAPPAN